MSSWRSTRKIPAWQAWMPEWLRTLLRWSFWGGLSLGGVAVVVALYFFSEASRFDLAEVGKMPARTLIFDRGGKEIGSAGGNNRRLVTRKDLPDFLVHALCAREDKTFYKHYGVDLRGLARATKENLERGKYAQGASTLSMQLARNTYGEEHAQLKGKSIHRKLLEIALTLRIEARYSKDEILANYLNRIYFGSGCHGVDQAARTYFGKPVSELNEAECAMVVGIIRGPAIYSPFASFEAAKEQEEQVLARMKAENMITEADVLRIQKIPVRLVPQEQRENEQSYALQAVQKQLQQIIDEEDIRDGGLMVRSTLDSAWQARLESDLGESLQKIEQSKDWQYPVKAKHQAGQDPAYLQCAAVTLETKTGAVLALIGGRDYGDSRFDRSSGARRDLGAAFEPWVAAAAAERGKLVLPGKPVQTGRQIGPKETARIAKRCGINGPFTETEDVFRGTAAATPMELATGLATLGNDGNRPDPFLILSIASADGKTLYEAKPAITPAITKQAAREAAALLESTANTRVYGGATGSGRDAWLARLGPRGSTAIWVGFDQPQKINTPQKLDEVLADIASKLGN